MKRRTRGSREKPNGGRRLRRIKGNATSSWMVRLFTLIIVWAIGLTRVFCVQRRLRKETGGTPRWRLSARTSSPSGRSGRLVYYYLFPWLLVWSIGLILPSFFEQVERAALVSAAEAAASKSEVSLFLILVWAIRMTSCFVDRLRPREPPMPSPKSPPTTRGRRNGPTYSPSSTPTGEQCNANTVKYPNTTQIPPEYILTNTPYQSLTEPRSPPHRRRRLPKYDKPTTRRLDH